MFESYYENGYQVIPNVFLPEVLVNVQNKFLYLINEQLAQIEHDKEKDLHNALKVLFQADIERYKQLVSSLWRNLEVFKLCNDEKVIKIIQSLWDSNTIFLPGGQVVHIQSFDLAIPGGYFGFNAHQDFPSVQGSLDGVIVWIPLHDIDEKNFPLEVIPKSHTKGILPLLDSRIDEWEISPASYSELDFTKVKCNRGDIVLMSYFTVHRTSRSGDNRLRLSCSTRFDNGEERSFVERCYPTAYVRSVKREMNMIRGGAFFTGKK